jgi:hypothetical protein
MKTGEGAQAIFRFCHSNLNGCNVGIIDKKELRNAPLRWPQGGMIYIPNSMNTGTDLSLFVSISICFGLHNHHQAIYIYNFKEN